MIYDWLKFAQRTLLPQNCALCGLPTGDDHALCPTCWQDLPFNPHPCAGCALPLPLGTLPDQLCGGCLQQRPVFHQAYTPLIYQAPVSTLIQRYKFHRQLRLAPLLGALVADGLSRTRYHSKPDVIVPVPLHPRRLRTRGFNQSLEVARIIGHRLGLPVEPRLAWRRRATHAQAELGVAHRQANIRHAFAAGTEVQGLHISVVDDIITTGATVSELARTLLRAGARRVDVWAIARALPS